MSMKQESVRTVRTAVQVALSVCAVMPMLVGALGIESASGAGAVLIAVAAGITRFHAVPAVNELLNKYLKIPK